MGALVSASLSFDGCFQEQPSTAVQAGGMWLPGQLSHEAHQSKLRSFGFELPQSSYTDLRGYPLGAIAKVGGCSASFVSELGLMVTNHHCIRGLLTALSQEGEDLLKSGYVAQSQEQERPAPGFTGSITLSSVDVTQQMLSAVDPSMDESQRHAALTQKQQELISICQKEHPQFSCNISSFFDDNYYELYTTSPLNDLRLVYVPPEGVGWFGADEDNWRWPRQTGDFAFIRAYGRDGKPLQPQQHLRIASEPLGHSDPVMVAGYPGRTYRYQSGARVRLAEDLTYPYLVERLTAQTSAMKELMGKDPTIETALRARLFSLSNMLIMYRATLEGMARSRYAEERLTRDALLDRWIQASPERSARFGSVVQELESLVGQSIPNYAIDMDAGFLAKRMILLGRARSIVKQAKARAGGATTTDQEVSQFVEEFSRMSNPRINVPGLEQAQIEDTLLRMSKDKPEGEFRVRSILGLGPSDPLQESVIRNKVAAMYQATTLQEIGIAKDLFRRATLEDLTRSEDGIVQAALALDAILERINASKPYDADRQRRLRRLYTKARVDFADSQGRLLAPDANLSLRVSYGNVRGYRPFDQEFFYPPFSTATELLAKHRGEFPFALPQSVIGAIQAKNYGRYADPRIADLPVNFLSTVDSTGGNSGSATLNGKGELVGLLFDGNYEGVISDWQYDPEVVRAIHVDMRFVLWLLDTVMPSHRLLQEMGIAPRHQSVHWQG